jgi:hypothetical protein
MQGARVGDLCSATGDAAAALHVLNALHAGIGDARLAHGSLHESKQPGIYTTHSGRLLARALFS